MCHPYLVILLAGDLSLPFGTYQIVQLGDKNMFVCVNNFSDHAMTEG